MTECQELHSRAFPLRECFLTEYAGAELITIQRQYSFRT